MTEFKAAPIEYAPRTHSLRRYPGHPADGTPTTDRPARGGSRPAAAGTRTPPRPTASPAVPRQGTARSYGSTPARRAAATASPRVWAPSLRMAERR